MKRVEVLNHSSVHRVLFTSLVVEKRFLKVLKKALKSSQVKFIQA